MSVPDVLCPWGVTYDDVRTYCPTSPVVGEGGISQELADHAVAAATEAIRAATGDRFGVCERTAQPCGNHGCSGGCGAWCCSSTWYDRIDLDPLGRHPVVDIVQVSEGDEVLDESSYVLVDARWLLRVPRGTRWAIRRDIAATPPDLEITWTFGTPPPGDLVLSGVIPLACEMAKKLDGQACSIPDNVVSVSREGAQFVMSDVTAMVIEGLLGPPSVIAAIRRAHPWGASVAAPGGFLDPVALLAPPALVDVQGGAQAAPVDPDFDRVQGDVWTWDYDADDDISDWSNLRVTITDAPSGGTVLASTDDSSIVTTLTDFGDGRIWWQTDLDTTTVPTGIVWIEAAADVPAEGGPYTFMPARRLRVRPQAAP